MSKLDGVRERLRSISGENVRGFLRRNLLVLFTMGAIVLGITLGFSLRPLKLSPSTIKYFTYPGEILMRLLSLIMIPLVVSSLVTGIATLNGRSSGKMGVRAVVYYMVTTLLAVFLGIILVVLMKPGYAGSKGDRPKPGGVGVEAVSALDAILDLVRNLVPPNLVEVAFKQHKTIYVKDPKDKFGPKIPQASSAPGVNVLGLVFISLCVGMAISKMHQNSKTKHSAKFLLQAFDSFNNVVMYLVSAVIWYAPVGILFLVAGKILEMEDLTVVGRQLGMYMLTIILGLVIHGALVLPLLYFAVTRRNPYAYIGGVVQALLTALGTSSSSATLPITFSCLEENNGVDKRVTRFVLPIGATVNMDGTALYEAVAAIFIAQAYNVALDFGQIVTVSLTATLASIGAAGIPQAGLVTMVIVLSSVGLPTEGISLILIVDWFLDRLRTTVNVLGDSLGAGIVEHLSRQELQRSSGEMGNLENGEALLPV